MCLVQRMRIPAMSLERGECSACAELIFQKNGGMKMSKHAKRRSFIEVTNETKSSRLHIKAEGVIPSLVVALYFALLVLGAFQDKIKGFVTKIPDIIRKLHKHNYYYHGFKEKPSVWFEFSF